MKSSLVPHLVCPQCRSPIRITDDITRYTARLGVNQGVLSCFKGHEYKIVRGVPILIPLGTFNDQLQVADTFGQKWSMVPNYGHDKATRDFQREWYLKRFGWKTIDELKQFLGQKMKVLDAGCGLGGDVRMYATATVGEVFGVDISDGVFLAQKKLGTLGNVHIIKADMTRLPFPDSYFDFIACDQALHHTPDTHASFVELLRHVKSGGHIAFYVYKRKGAGREVADDLIRAYTTGMSHTDCEVFSAACARFGRDVSKLNLDLQRDIYWNVFKCFWNDDYDFNTNVAVNLDWYRPRYAWRHTPEEVKGWCAEANLTIEHFDVCDSGISVRGLKA